MPDGSGFETVGIDVDLAQTTKRSLTQSPTQSTANLKTYESVGVVNHYAQLRSLQPAEQTILDLLSDRLPSMTMLDIGVGGGRTTLHVAKSVKQYVGIDYSQRMITACQNRFRSRGRQSISFQVCDVRDMSGFEDDSFDFMLFSFNGLDYISHRDRLRVLKEIQRIGKSGSYFAFSSHNLQGIERDFNLVKQLSFNPLTMYVNLVMAMLLRIFNRFVSLKTLRSSPYAILKDESHQFRLQTYYVRPSEQLRQLEAQFTQVKVYSWKTGLEIADDRELSENTDQWLYYLCSIR